MTSVTFLSRAAAKSAASLEVSVDEAYAILKTEPIRISQAFCDEGSYATPRKMVQRKGAEETPEELQAATAHMDGLV